MQVMVLAVEWVQRGRAKSLRPTFRELVYPRLSSLFPDLKHATDLLMTFAKHTGRTKNVLPLEAKLDARQRLLGRLVAFPTP